MTRQWFDVLAGILAMVMLVLVGRETAAYAMVSFELNSPSDKSDLLRWPWMALIPVGLGLPLLGTVFSSSAIRGSSTTTAAVVGSVVYASSPA